MAATTAQTEEQLQVSLKLLVNKETNKVLFAEAGKDFVDVLFSFLTLPLGTIARLLEKESNKGSVTVGCLNTLYRSARDLDKECLRTDTTKEMLFQPENSSLNYCSALKLNIDDTKPTEYFLCSMFDKNSCGSFLSTSGNNNCSMCGNPMTRSVLVKHLSSGFVKDDATFVITDDLVVMPNSIQFTSFSFLQNSGVKNMSSVKEMIFNVTKEKVLDLLKCALVSKTPLTDLFLEKKHSLKRSRVFSCDVENNSDIKISLKLVIRKSDGKILFAQGEEDFAYFLLSFLTFPFGGVVRILGGNCCMGSIDTLYKSIVDLNKDKYLTSMEAKMRLIDPHLAPHFKSSKQMLPIQRYVPYYFYYQGKSLKESILHNQFFISNEYKIDEGERLEMLLIENPKSNKGKCQGYVKGLRTFVATDDLVFAPSSSPISTLYLINHLETPLNDLKEKFVTIGIKECMSILKAALTSTSALTDGLTHLISDVKEEK